MAATVSAWGKPGAWALDAEENDSELLQQPDEDSSAAHGKSSGGETADFPSLAAASSSGKTKKKKPQALSLQEFSAYSAGKPKGLTHGELSTLPTGPRERSAEELAGGFRSYVGGARDEQPRRQGSFNRESSRESSRADETDDWGANKKSSANPGYERRERGERGGFFGDTVSRADDVGNWASNKNFIPSEPRRYEKRGGFGSESSDGGSDSSNWARRKEEEGRRSGGAFDSLRERNEENWGRKREESSGGSRPRLNLQPRTLPVNEEAKIEDAKPKGSNPFGEARPREEVLKEKGQDCKEIKEKLESVNAKDVASKKNVWSGRESERSWRKLESVHLPQSCSGGETGNGNGGEGSYGHANN